MSLTKFLSLIMTLLIFLVTPFNISQAQASSPGWDNLHLSFEANQNRVRYNLWFRKNNYLGGFGVQQSENVDIISVMGGRRFKLTDSLNLQLITHYGRNFTEERNHSELQLQVFGPQRVGISAGVNNRGSFNLSIAYSAF